jgi:quercetin dioxygenase-like cupin family protein
VSDELTRLADLVAKSPHGCAQVPAWHDVNGGLIQGKGLYIEPPGDSDLAPGGAVALTRMAEGQAFPEHVQEFCTEILIVLKGLLEVTVREGQQATMILGPGMHVALQPGVPHTAKALVDSVVIGVTVPRDGGYPDAIEHAGGVCAGDCADCA